MLIYREKSLMMAFRGLQRKTMFFKSLKVYRESLVSYCWIGTGERPSHQWRNFGLKSGGPSSRCSYKVWGSEPPLQKVAGPDPRPPWNYAYAPPVRGQVDTEIVQKVRQEKHPQLSTVKAIREITFEPKLFLKNFSSNVSCGWLQWSYLVKLLTTGQ